MSRRKIDRDTLHDPEPMFPLGINVCWQVNDHDHEHFSILFASSAAAARRRFQNEHDQEGETCIITRHPEWDRYEASGVPIKAQMEAGWHWECSGCYRSLTLPSEHEDSADDFDDDDFKAYGEAVALYRHKHALLMSKLDTDPASVPKESWDPNSKQAIEALEPGRLHQSNGFIYSHNRVWCSLECRVSDHIDAASWNLRHEEAEVAARKQFPWGLTFSAPRYPGISERVEITFPGGSAPATWKYKEDPDHVFVNQNDAETWRALKAASVSSVEAA